MKKKNITKKIIPATVLALALVIGGVGIAGCENDTTKAEAAEQPPGAPPDGGGAPPDGGGGPGGQQSTPEWSAANTISDSNTYTDTSYSSTTAGENALMIKGDSASPTLTGTTATKTGEGVNGDGASFYGTNSAIIVKDGAVATIDNATITTDSEGANGVFSYGGNGGQNGASGDGTTVNISNSTITTTKGGSGGIMTTGGGITNATNLTVTTSGQSSAAIRTDRGGGTVNVNGGTYTTNGLGSPAIYSTAAVSVSDATLISNKSEGVCIEGTNSVNLKNCDLTATNTEKNGNAQYLDSIMIYQSMSGDASGTDSSFTMTDGTLNSKSGHVFHVTNTSAEINLNSVSINNTDTDNVLLSVVNDGWSGAENKATLNATSQTLSGKIIVSNTASSASSSKSTLNLNIDNNSSFEGSIGDENSSGSALGTVNVKLDGSWKLTGDSYVTSIDGSGIIDYNGYALYVNGTAYTSGTPGGSITEGDAAPSSSDVDDGSDDATDDTATVTVGKVNTVKVTRSKNKKKMTVKASAVTDAEGYQIAYSTSKKFTSKTTKKVTTSSTKKTIKSLKKKKTYYVKVRAYIKNGSTKTYGKWSTVKKVK
ncbi:MAG: hypothetical protein K5639_02505 [Eubacterium sp.]|nr:hypothetical protein [Eubacterium sp.]